jgi:hypothetical protein
MKYIALAFLVALSAGCASKKIMRNCKTLNLGYFECENK